MRLLGDQRGAATVEYVIVLALVTIGASLAIVGLGLLLLELYLFQQSVLLLPLP